MTIAINPDTDLPLGHVVCLACGVSWSAWWPVSYCWSCGERGQTTSEAVAAIQSVRHDHDHAQTPGQGALFGPVQS